MSRLIGVIDAGTNKIRFVIYKTPNFEELCSHEVRIKQISKKEGWLEHDPKEIIDAIRECAKVAIHLLPNHGFSKSNVSCIGITNQRETVLMWNKDTGEPLHNAIGKSHDLLNDTDLPQSKIRWTFFFTFSLERHENDKLGRRITAKTQCW